MLEFRLYRIGLLLALAAAVVLMFSVVSRPSPIRSDTAADAFDGARAAGLDRQLISIAPDRTPGSRGDRAAAAFVTRRLAAVQGGQVSVQRFSAGFDGDDVQMRNISLVLPGLSDRQIVVVAPRDCDGGPCAASSGAATGALLELANAFDGASHRKTLVFVSTDGSVAGAAGAKTLADSLRQAPTEAVIVLSQPGSGSGRHPYVVPWSAGPQSTSIQLVESARSAVSAELGGNPLDLGTLSSLLHLAIPSGLGEQAPLIDRGFDAVGLSSAGARPLPASEDGPGSLDPAALGGFGRATLSMVFALDGFSEPLDHGPDAYLPLAGKLIPGWALALLAAALLLPVGLICVDGLAAASRGGEPVLRTLLWVLAGAAPFLGTLLFASLLALAGLIGRPAFPFDPATHSPGVGGALVLLALAAAFVIAVVFTQRLRPPPDADLAITPAVGMVTFAAAAIVWLVDPYLALLLVPTAHLWLIAAMPELRGRILPVALIVLLGAIVPLLAISALGGVLGVGLAVPWQLLLMFTGGQFGPIEALAMCALGGCLLVIVELAIRDRARAPSRPSLAGQVGRHRGPGALGGPPSAPVPGHKL
jgi:hypothetical protein